MKITCISASNVMHKQETSASRKTCDLAGEIIRAHAEDADTQTICLSGYNFENCTFCGCCAQGRGCIHDQVFNDFYRHILESDSLVMVVPFYSIVPSRVSMFMEKLNQFYYTAWLRDPKTENPMSGKKVAVIAHGGTNLENSTLTASLYRDLLLQPLNYSFRSLGFQVVGAGEETPGGVVFGVEGYARDPSSIFPAMVHDWEKVRRTITPLILQLLQ